MNKGCGNQTDREAALRMFRSATSPAEVKDIMDRLKLLEEDFETSDEELEESIRELRDMLVH